MSLFLLQMAGFPGSGKTEMSRAIGRKTGAAVIDKDVIMAAAMRSGVVPENAGGLAYEAGFDLARSMLGNGLSVVLDTPAQFTIIRERGACIAEQAGGAYFIIECVVPDAVANARLASRQPAHELHPPSLEGVDVAYSRPGTSPLTEPHLTLDTTRPFDECLQDALEYLGT